MELLCSLILFCSLWIRIQNKNAKYERISGRDWTNLVLGGPLHGGLFFGVIYWTGQASRRRKSVLEFLSACKAVETTVPLPPIGTLRLLIDPPSVVIHSNKALNKFLFFLICVAGVGILLCCKLLKMLGAKLKAISPEPVKDFGRRIAVFEPFSTLAAMGLTACMLYCFAKMHLVRQQLASVAHDEFTDNEWGFGQVVALFVWVPLIVEILLALGFALGIVGILESVNLFFDRLRRRKVWGGKLGVTVWC
jgi:hypothetical protein